MKESLLLKLCLSEMSAFWVKAYDWLFTRVAFNRILEFAHLFTHYFIY